MAENFNTNSGMTTMMRGAGTSTYHTFTVVACTRTYTKYGYSYMRQLENGGGKSGALQVFQGHIKRGRKGGIIDIRNHCTSLIGQ